MNRLKLLAAAMLLALPIISACGDPPPAPPPTGTIDGLVSIEGQGIDGVSVTLSNGASASTANGGMFRFDGVKAGMYTVTITNYPDDASFDQTSAAATIATDGETVTVNFPGTYIRTSSIMGTVTVENQGLVGVTVKLTGPSPSETLTDASGQYAFAGLRAGNYTIEISGFDEDDVAFSSTSSAASIAVGESKVVTFQGTYLRTSAIQGQVTADEEPQEGITVTVQGKGEEQTATTNATGQYSIENLRAGDYSVVITGYDTDQMSFETTSQTVTVGLGETANAPFEGILLRTGGIAGTVTVEGEGPIEGVTVTIQGEGENETRETDDAGEYLFGQLPAGDYSVRILNPNDDEYGFDVTSQTVEVELKQTATASFEGILLRTAAIAGAVELRPEDGGAPLSNVSVRISGGPKNEHYSLTTNNDGTYRVDRLHAGDYSIEITNPDADEYGFEATTQSVTVDLRETLAVDFSGTLLRTVMATGMVTVEDFGPLAGVEITVSGGLKGLTHTATTDADGVYELGRLYAGTYSVTMTNPNDDEYGFDMPMVDGEMVELRETLEVDFSGILLRTVVIAGTVSLRPEDGGTPLPNVAVTVSGGPKDEEFQLDTRNDGTYRVDRLHAGEYSVEIMNPDADEYEFDANSRTVEVDLKETGTADFSVTLLRTVMATGMVTVEDFGPLEGVEITISGGRNNLTHTATTDADGMYELDRLYAGTYSVTMTNPNDDEYGFDMPMVGGEEVELRGTLDIDFSGILLRTATIAGKVTVGEDTPLSGVTLTVSGGPKDESHDATTNADGEYEVDRLHQGDYTVSLKDFNRVEYGFDPESVGGVMAVRKDTETVNFNGIFLRTAGVSGSVTVPGVGNVDATVTLSMEGEDDRSMETQGGQYGFSGLAAGDYTLTLSGYDAVEYQFNDSREFSLELNESSIQNFVGKALRTGTIMGTVSDEEGPLAGIAVTLIRVISATSGEVMGATATDGDGAYSFGPLLAGAYQVMIAGYSDEHNFADGTTWSGAVATDGTSEANFTATIIRTAGVSGMVMVDDEAMAGVTVTLTGGEQPEDGTSMETGDDGMYSFDMLRKGDYMVTITNPDDNSYNFPMTAREVDLAVGQTQDGISFSGTRLKRGSISGQVHAEGEPIEGVTVTLSGDADATDETDANGEYNFPGLAVGGYTVTIDHPGDAYVFTDEELTGDADIVNNDDFVILDFEGKHARNGSVMGKLFIDEGPDPGEYHSSEPMLSRAAWADYLPAGAVPDVVTGVPLALHGPGINDPVQYTMADTDGNYEFSGLVKGDYLVRVALTVMNPLDPTGDPINVGALLDHAGYALGGENNDVGVPVNVAAGAASEQDFPFMITKQTIHVGAVMGTPEMATATKVGGVTLALYATAEDADANRNPLIAAMKTGGAGTEDMPNPAHGVATFQFDREDDKGPGGADNDHLVFAKVTSTGHADLEFADNEAIEIQYAATDRMTNALAAARLVNVQVNTQWWVKSNETAKDGNDRLSGWKVKMGDATYTTADSAAADVAAADHGKAVFGTRLTVPEAMAGASYTFALDEDGQAYSVTSGEDWKQSAALTHDHDHLALPAANTAEMNDLGPIYVTWTTQKLTVGVYREADDTEGYTDFRSALASGDSRPHAEVADGMTVELLARDSRNRLRRYEWDPDPKTGEFRKEGFATLGERGTTDGMHTFTGIPTSAELTIRYRPGTGRKQMDYGYDDIETHDNDLDIGVTQGAFGNPKAGRTHHGGGTPEVKMCSASATDKVKPRPEMPLSDEWCATFAYQWNTGRIHGDVGVERNHVVTARPETGHGASDDDDKTDKYGAYAIPGLQDGVYTAEAESGNAKYAILGTAKVTGIALYHNEACWAATNPEPAVGDDPPSACAGESLIQGTNDDDEKTWKYDNAHEQNWRTVRLGLAISGYVANDGQDGEDRDGLLRGDELKAGITMTLKAGAKTLQTTDTDASGFYSFKNLAAGNYTVIAGAASNAIALMERRARGNVTWRTATAQDYPTFPDEQDVAKPYWNRTTNAAGQLTTTIVDDQGTSSTADDESGILYNFALVYTDGQLTGVVNNMSGSNAGIDIELESPIPGQWIGPVVTGPSGAFEVNSLWEGIDYSAVIQDKWWTPTCLNAAGYPDDDAVDGNGMCNSEARTTLMAGIEGENDHENLGTLHVYDNRLSDVVGLATLSVKGITEIGGYAVEMVSGAIPAAGPGASTDISSNVTGTTTYRDNTVTVVATGPAGAGVTLSANGQATDATVDLRHNATGSASAGDARANDITVMVEAANGYNDHEYTFQVSRAAPAGNMLAGADIMGSGTPVSGDGSNETPFKATTESTTDADVTLTFNLAMKGAGDDEYCAQSVSVKLRNAANDIDAANDTDNDVCSGEQYALSAGASSVGNFYEVTITSEDDVEETYLLNVTKMPETLSSDAVLSSLTYEGEAETGLDAAGDVAITKAEAHNVAQVTIDWTLPDGATAAVDPADADANTDGHQLDLGDPETSTEFELVVTAQDGTTTKTYTITVTKGAVPPTDPGITLLAPAADDASTASENLLVSAMDIAEGDTVVYFVRLATLPTADVEVTVNVGTTGIVVASGADNTGGSSLSFLVAVAETETGYWGTPQRVRLTMPADDADAEPNDALEVQHSAIEGGDADSGTYDIAAADGPAVELTIEETDTKGVIVSATGIEIPEVVAGGTRKTRSYTVVLNSEPTGPTAVSIGGTLPSGVSLSVASVNFDQTSGGANSWDTPQTVTITGPAGDVDEVDNDFTLTHSASSGGYDGESVSDVEVTVKDTSIAAVAVSVTAATVAENGTFTLVFSLTKAPATGETVTVRLGMNTGQLMSGGTTSVDLTDLTDSSAVTITGLASGTITYTVSSSGGGADAVYGGVTTATSTVVTVIPSPSS
jgi:hypothetical protein